MEAAKKIGKLEGDDGIIVFDNSDNFTVEASLLAVSTVP